MTERPASRILGVGSFLPRHVVTSAEIERRLGCSDHLGVLPGLIERATGVRERRYAKPGASAAALAAKASRRALAMAKLDAAEVDAILFAAVSQDIYEPATANLLQEMLRARNAFVLDVKNACNAFLNALDLADCLICTGRARHVLVASGEVISWLVNWEVNRRDDLRRSLAAFTLGDGAGAVTVGPARGQHGILAAAFRSDGRRWREGAVEYAGTRHPRDLERSFFYSDAEALNHDALREVPPVIRSVLWRAGWRAENLDLVVPHQAPRAIISRIARRVGVPIERCQITLGRFGNTAAASIPIALSEAEADGKLRAGAKVLLVGGASGFSAAAMAMRW